MSFLDCLRRSRPAAPRRPWRRAAVAGWLAVAALGAMPGARGQDEGGGELKPADMKARVELVKLETGRLPLQLHALGRIGAPPQARTTVSALADGVVDRVAARVGERVSSGTLLMTLDSRAARALLDQARSALATAQSEARHGESTDLAQQQSGLDAAARQARSLATQARAEATRQADLLAKGLTSSKAADEAKRAAEAAEADAAQAEMIAANFRKSGRAVQAGQLLAKVREAQASLRLAEIDLEATSVTAPVSGRVTSLGATPGQSVGKGTVLAELEPAGSLGVRFGLAPAMARQVPSGAAFALSEQVEATSDTQPLTLTGRVVAVGAGIDPATGLVQVDGILEPIPEGTPQPFAGEVLDGAITLAISREGFLVPRSALSMSDAGPAVTRVDKDRHATPVPVKIETESATQAIVTSEELAEGDQIVSDGNYNLPEGAGVVTAGVTDTASQAKAATAPDGVSSATESKR